MESKPTAIHRSRSGCWNCRRRRCTEEYPDCKDCVKRQLKCHYGIRLLWQDEAESAGIAFGRAGVKSRQRQSNRSSDAKLNHYLLPIIRSRWHWLNITSSDVAKLCLRCDLNDSPEKVAEYLDRDLVPAIQRPLSDFPQLNDDGSSYLLEHYIRVWSCRRVLTHKSENPFQQIILPLCLQSQGLLDIIIALGAHDMRNHVRKGEVQRFDAIVLRQKLRSLHYLHSLMGDDGIPNNTRLVGDQSARDSLLLIIMMHGLLEIATNSTKEWTVHMQGALSVIKHLYRIYGKNAFSPDALQFVSDYFTQNDTFLATTGDLGLFGWTNQLKSILPETDDRNRSRVNGYTGLSHELLDIISSTTTVLRSRRELANSKETAPIHDVIHLENQARTIQYRLRQLRQWSEESDRNELISLNAAAFEEATWIYIQHSLNKDPSDSESIQNDHLPKLLALLQTVQEKHGSLFGSLPYPMWALFIAACVVQEDHRADILDWFTTLKELRPFSNVPIVMAAVEVIWKKRDLEHNLALSEASKARSRGGLAWEDAIHFLGWKMALI